ncbi:uncharacterized protein A4U43_C03F20510 [Asparagus officinalis]|uniref:Uncharacterized protein n=1 Tax=Asparagus officinalis TaxID=4686 RepID=A0A5P1FDG6_ASPOF|nr:uncharacterized protein A4U43_C03F20510 [Asparagus officinalis]
MGSRFDHLFFLIRNRTLESSGRAAVATGSGEWPAAVDGQVAAGRLVVDECGRRVVAGRVAKGRPTGPTGGQRWLWWRQRWRVIAAGRGGDEWPAGNRGNRAGGRRWGRPAGGGGGDAWPMAGRRWADW